MLLFYANHHILNLWITNITTYLLALKLFQDKNLSTGLFFLELLSAAEPRVVNWNLVTKGENGMQVC